MLGLTNHPIIRVIRREIRKIVFDRQVTFTLKCSQMPVMDVNSRLGYERIYFEPTDSEPTG